MRQSQKRRKRAFTLVELLIVIMIIALLAGMIMLAAASSTHSAEAAKVINDLRDMKAAATLYYMNEHKWPAGSPLDAATVTSIESFMDGRSVSIFSSKYTALHVLENMSNERSFIGIEMKSGITSGVRRKLADNAKQIGLYEDENGAHYSGAGLKVFMNMK